MAVNFKRRRRFDVYLEIFQKELSLLRDNFDLSGTDRYIIVWGNGILNNLNRVTRHCCHCDFSELDCFRGYEIRLFGSHYRSCGGTLRSIPPPNQEEKTIRRIYRSPQERTADNREDRQRFEFEILRNRTAPPQQVVFL